MTGDRLPETGRWRGLIVLLTLAHVIGTVGYVTIMATAPLIRAELGLNATQIGSFMSAFSLALGVTALPAGLWVDRIGVGKALAVSMVLLAAGAAGFASVQSYLPAVLASFVMGVGYGLVNPATAKGVLDGFAAAERATAMGVKQTGVPVGGLIAAGLAAWAGVLTWRGILLGVAGITVLLGIAWWWRSRHDRAAPSRSKGLPLPGIRAVFANRGIIALNGAGFAFNGAQQSLATYLTLFLRDAAMASQPFASFCLGAAQVAGACGRILWSLASDRLARGRRKIVLVVMMSMAALAFAAAAAIGQGWPQAALVFVAVAAGATVLAYAPLMHTACAEAVEAGNAGAAIGTNLLATALGGTVCPLAFGALVDALGGYGWAWFGVALITAVGVLAIVIGLDEGRRR